MASQWNPNYIKKQLAYNPHDVISAEEFNALFNMLITTVDNMTAYMQYLTEGGFEEVAPMFTSSISSYIEATIKPELQVYIEECIAAMEADITEDDVKNIDYDA